ncbi:hypothetical protein JF50_19495 [Pseudoalteromonas luteoviolacea]|uniref:Tetratricopeptide repeat protein n=1 Tax=Pseudoalteromonas luteoviolacea TaxID=43657 RepID=A0A0C1QAD9_9GAMM|nr:hypothetical protein [Pseudoalteromonas luteoviolacea]KID56400.1 hypothetical protein JF50_19495 [Pseudoalteromonas luteoviolacea]
MTPQTVLPSVWIPHLFAEKVPEDELELKAIMAFYNLCMDKIIQGDFSLPEECILTQPHLKNALLSGMPLPNYCSGMLCSLSFIKQADLTVEQDTQLKTLQTVLEGFQGYLNAFRAFPSNEQDFTTDLISAYQSLEPCISKTAYELRFSEQCISQADEVNSLSGFDRKQIESHLNDILSKNNASTLKFIDELISVLERELITTHFIEQYGNELENLSEIQPYFILKARKAQIHFNLEHYDLAQKELEELLNLAPNDYYENRYQLYNCYIKQGKWHCLTALLNKYKSNVYSENKLMDSATILLNEYAQHGSNPKTNALKEKVKGLFPDIVSMSGSSAELGADEKSDCVNEYINKGGLTAWCSVEGSLFWLKSR